jgi:hypothetical protein
VIRLILGVTLCMSAVDADPSAPAWLLVLSALIGLTLAGLGARSLWSTAK